MKLNVNPDAFAFAGSASAIAGVIAFHEAGHLLAAKSQGMKVTSYNLGYGPKLFAFNDSSSTEFALRAFPFGGYVAFPANIEVDDDGEVTEELTDPDLIQNRPPLQRAFVISAGIIANILLTLLLTTGAACTTGISRPTFSPGVLVTAMPDANSPAVVAGLRADDVITRLDGQEVRGSYSTLEDFIAVVRANPNRPLAVEYQRDGLLRSTSVTPSLASSGKGTIGIAISNRVASTSQVVARNPIEAVEMGAEETALIVSLTWSTFARAVSSGFTSQEMGGTLAVVQTGASLASRVGPAGLVGFAATLSVNLAVLNALPLPALDGGQLVFVLVELAAGKPLPRRLQSSLTSVAFALLFGLGLTTLAGDLGKLTRPSELVGSAVQIIAKPPPSPLSK